MATQMNRVCSAFIFLFGLAVLLGIASVGSLQASQQDADQFAGPAGQSQDEERASEGDAGAEGTGEEEDRQRGMGFLDPLPAVYQADFRGQKFDRGTLIPYGFETLYGLQLLKPEPRGLRVVIPYHQGVRKPSIGLLPLLKINGDFEVTATCELLGTEPPKHGFAAGAGVFIMAEETLHGAVLRRGVRPNGDHVYLVNGMTRGDDGKVRSQIKFFPAENRTGQLRLRRQGTRLEFLVAEEKSDQFRKLHEVEFGKETIGLVRLEATTERSPTSVEVLWKDLTIRAQELTPVNTPLFGATTLPARNVSPSVSHAAPPAAEDKALRIEFQHQPWEDVLEWYADQAGLSLVMDAPPPGTFNYTDSRQYTPIEALDLLNRVLSTKKFRLVRRDETLIVFGPSE